MSKGFRQRVGLAAALIHKPSVLILDEPSSGLDPKQIIEMRKLIENLRSEHTIILSTHLLSEVKEICSRLLILTNGTIGIEGSIAELSEQQSLEELFLNVVYHSQTE